MAIPRRIPAPVLLVALVAPAACGGDGGFSPDPSFRREVWVQPDPRPADVLWVVDTSCSMMDEQEALVENFPAFVDLFVASRLSFHIGVTTTNIDEAGTTGQDGHLVGDPLWLTEQTPDLGQAFLERALLGIDEGHGDEKGLEAAYVALEELGQEAHAGFVRDGATLSVVVVSDEMDFSETGEPGSADVIDWEGFSVWLDGTKPFPEDSALSGIVGVGPGGFDDPAGCGQTGGAQQGTGAERGSGYLEAIEATGGLWQSICSDDWAELLGRLGVLVAGLEDTVPLAEIPLLDTLAVDVSGQAETRWEYLAEGNSIRFTEYEAVPDAGEQVEITYHVP